MSSLKNLFPRFVFLASFSAWAFIVGLMVLIARYNVPSIVDDFCFAWVSKQYGIFSGAYYYYMGWSGRYFGNLLMHSTPLYFSSNFVFLQLNTYFLLLFGFGTSIYTIKRISQWSFGDYRLWTGVFLFQAAALYSISGLYQWFYWFSGIYYYVSFQFVLLLLVTYFILPVSRKRTILLSFFVFCLMGCSEVSMLMFSGVFWGYQCWIWRFKGPIKKDLYYLFAVWLIGFLIVMLSPGNQVRAVTNVNLAEGIHILLANFKDLLIQFFSAPYLWAFIAWVWWGFSPESMKPMSLLNLAIISVLFFGSMVVSFIPLSFALGEVHIPARILSLFLLFLMLYVSFMLIHLKHYVSHGQGVWAGLLLLIFLGTGVWKSSNARLLREELSTGRASAYFLANKVRFDQIQLSTKDTVAVDPLPIKSKLFFGEELSKDPKHLWCKCVANYYGKKAVHLK